MGIGLMLIAFLFILQIFNVWDKAMNIGEPLLGVLLSLQALEKWKTDRPVALVSLVAALVILF
jgi:hypothetical protein